MSAITILRDAHARLQERRTAAQQELVRINGEVDQVQSKIIMLSSEIQDIRNALTILGST